MSDFVLQSWTVGGTHLSIAAAAVFSERCGNYAAVVTESSVGRQRALFWSHDFSGTLLNAPSSVSLQLGSSHQVVWSLFPHPGTGSKHDFIAVLGDCTVILLDSSAGSMSRLFGQAGLTTLHACMDSKTLYVMARCTHAAGNGKSASSEKTAFTLVGLPFGSSSSEDIWSTAVKPPRISAALQSFIVCGVTLTCVWSNGSVTVSSVNPSRGVRSQHTLDISAADVSLRSSQAMNKKRRNQDAPNDCHAIDTCQSKCSIVALHEHAVVVIAPGKDAQGVQFVVLNTLFGAPVRTGHVGQGMSQSLGSFSLLAAQPSMVDHRCHESVVLARGGSVVRAMIPVPQPSLASAVGCLAPARHDAQAALLSADYLLRQQTASCPQSLKQANRCVGSDSNELGKDAGSSRHTSFLVRAQSSWQLGGSDDDKDLVNMLQSIALAAGPVEDADKAKELLSVLSTSSILLTGDLVEKLARRLQASKQWVLLEHLIRHRPLRALPLCPHILATLAQAGQYRMLKCLMREARDVAHHDFVDMVRELTAGGGSGTVSRHSEQWAPDMMQSYAYGVASKLCCHAEAKKRSLQSCQAAAAAVAAVEGFSGAQIAMHAALACRLDLHDILNACRALDGVRAENLLGYLQQWLERMLGDSSGAWFHEVLWCVHLHLHVNGVLSTYAACWRRI